MKDKIFFILFFPTLIIQIAFPPFLKIFGIKPGLILILVSFYIVYFDAKDSLLKCIVAAFLKDSFTLFPFGVSILTYLGVFYLVYILKKIFYQRNEIIFLVAVFMGSWINFFFAQLYVFFRISPYHLIGGMGRSALESFYSVILSTALIFWLKKCVTKRFISLQSVFSY